MVKYWFTADLHFGHENIIKYCRRPFINLDSMDCRLIDNWNSRVKQDDYIFHLGDFCYKNSHKFSDYVRLLNGNIIFLKGNHDGNNGVRTPIINTTIKYGSKHIFLTHKPENVIGFDGELALCGHVHNLFKFKTLDVDGLNVDVCNVGVDVWQGRPVDINEIMADYQRWKKSGNENIKSWAY